MSNVSEAKKKMRYANLKADYVQQGFHKLDDNLIEKRPPKIQWGESYKQFHPDEKIEYLEKLASTMNHAARLIQDERNQLLILCDKKDLQIEQMKEAVAKNMNMLQSEVAKMNSDRHSGVEGMMAKNKTIKKLQTENKELRDRLKEAGLWQSSLA